VKAVGWTSHGKDGHGEEVTDMQRMTHSARCAAGVPSETCSRGADIDNSGRAGDYQV
jgi:hypothetical protein